MKIVTGTLFTLLLRSIGGRVNLNVRIECRSRPAFAGRVNLNVIRYDHDNDGNAERARRGFHLQARER